jgi:aspartate racemase
MNDRGVILRVIGLIGGMSWESTALYYRQINEAIRECLGGLHSAKIILYSVDFHEVERLQRSEDWQAAGLVLADAARALESAGADFLVLCTNTMHRVAPVIEAAVRIPLFHIVDPTAGEIKKAGFSAIGLLGTRFTMEQEFYKGRLSVRHGLKVFVPKQQDREIIHRVIYDELCLGRIVDASRFECRRIMADLVTQGVQAIILGCTELSMLVGPEESAVPLFDTTTIHARKAADRALSAT